MAAENKKTNWIIYAIIGIVIIGIIAYVYYLNPSTEETTETSGKDLNLSLPNATEPILINGNTLVEGPKIPQVNNTDNTGTNNG